MSEIWRVRLAPTASDLEEATWADVDSVLTSSNARTAGFVAEHAAARWYGVREVLGGDLDVSDGGADLYAEVESPKGALWRFRLTGTLLITWKAKVGL